MFKISKIARIPIDRKPLDRKSGVDQRFTLSDYKDVGFR